ncbi:dimethylarginine dimethylaminohydrolase family protein [Curvivirga aplysinae]|uniref:dimethylarginine dimethylaminohydrolase family protein n=1 Tax=Curvivirga aplysinae TaxID=2529852 RepID=UPI0012BB609A|nr:arginine deiminase family protein [Curvivirga aplysinae]MTI10040.1 amidinotransferase [Curvivirga aplysinae]
MSKFNEFGKIERMAIRPAPNAFKSQAQADAEWEDLRFHQNVDVNEAYNEYEAFKKIFTDANIQLDELPANDDLTLDAIYVRDAAIIAPNGLILMNMGRVSRNNEPKIHGEILGSSGVNILGEIKAPGKVEGGDFIWVNEKAAAIGLGPRTNQEGIDQLKAHLGDEVDLFVCPLPDPSHPDDVFHLMSMISPVAEDLAVIYRPLMPDDFIKWLEGHGIGFVEVPEEEFLPMACNVLAIAPREVVMLDKLPLTKGLLEDAGCKVHTYKGDEISRKGEGGPTCLTRPLVRS